MPLMYEALAEWWPLLSPPDEYEEEAAAYARLLSDALGRLPSSILELGSGGGNNASHLKHVAPMTLVDPSRAMRDVSARLNPECVHVDGDMRTVRLPHAFDAVFIHDAVCYMTTLDDLRAAMTTGYVHCAPGGAVLMAPDFVRETFRPDTGHGGHDEPSGRGLRYLEWSWDPDPDDTTYVVEYALLLREQDGSVRAAHDRHVEGLFSRTQWLDALRAVGFVSARCHAVELLVGGPVTTDVFVARRPAELA